MSFLRTARLLPSTASAAQQRLFSTTPRSAFAKMQIVGRLGMEPELTNTASGKELVKYVVATSYGPRDDPKTSWFRVACFEPAGPKRDYILGLPKGSLVHIDADARLDTYEDAEGKKRSSLNLIHRSIDVIIRSRNHEAEGAEGAEAEASG